MRSWEMPASHAQLGTGGEHLECREGGLVRWQVVESFGQELVAERSVGGEGAREGSGPTLGQ